MSPLSESDTERSSSNHSRLAKDMPLAEANTNLPHRGTDRPPSHRLSGTESLTTQDPNSPQNLPTLIQPTTAETVNSSSDMVAIDRAPTDTSHTIEMLPPLFPTPKRTGASKCLWAGILLSLGLHAGLVLMPTGREPMPTPPKEADKQVRITQLPKLVKTITVKKPPKPTVKPVVRQPTAPPIPQPKATPTPQAAQPQTTPEATASSWDDFPIYPGAQPGCFGLGACLQSTDGLSQVADYYGKELAAKKYEAKPALKEASRQVLQVSRNGQSQFLSLIQTDNGSVMVLSDAPRSLEDLKKAVEVPPEVAEILGNLDAQNADQSNFGQPDLFYTQSTAKGLGAGALVPNPGIRNISMVSGYAYDTMMDEFFRSNLQLNDYEVTDLPQEYGGGKLYQVTKGNVKLYLNLVPTRDNSGTLIVTWKDPPR